MELGARNSRLSQNLLEAVKDFVMKIMKIMAVELINIIKVMLSHKYFKYLMEIVVNVLSE